MSRAPLGLELAIGGVRGETLLVRLSKGFMSPARIRPFPTNHRGAI